MRSSCLISYDHKTKQSQRVYYDCFLASSSNIKSLELKGILRASPFPTQYQYLKIVLSFTLALYLFCTVFICWLPLCVYMWEWGAVFERWEKKTLFLIFYSSDSLVAWNPFLFFFLRTLAFNLIFFLEILVFFLFCFFVLLCFVF